MPCTFLGPEGPLPVPVVRAGATLLGKHRARSLVLTRVDSCSLVCVCGVSGEGVAASKRTSASAAWCRWPGRSSASVQRRSSRRHQPWGAVTFIPHDTMGWYYGQPHPGADHGARIGSLPYRAWCLSSAHTGGLHKRVAPQAIRFMSTPQADGARDRASAQ